MRITGVRFVTGEPSEQDPHVLRSYGSFKNVNAEFDWAPFMVLFGRNGAGKSNILEAVATLFSDPDAPAVVRTELLDEYRRELGWLVTAVIELELDGLDQDGSSDERLLAELLQFEEPRVLFGAEHSPWQWDSPSSREGNSVDLRDGQSPIRFGTESLGLDALRVHLRTQITRRAQATCSDWDRVREPYGRLVDFLLASRWFALYAEESGVDIWWLTPPADVASDSTQRDARALLNERHTWPDGVVPYIGRAIDTILDGAARYTFMPINTLPAFRPFEPIQVTYTPDGLEAFRSALSSRLEELQQVVLRAATWHGSNRGRTVAYHVPQKHEDPWVEEVDEELSRLHPIMLGLTGVLSYRATMLAPSFVTDEYEITVGVINPIAWRQSGGARLMVGLEDRRSGQQFDIHVVGSGIALWTAYALVEAVRDLERDASKLLADVGKDVFEKQAQQLLSDLLLFEDNEEATVEDAAEPPEDTSDAENESHETVTLPQRSLYIIDEPEQHLHPDAQREAATWLARIASAGAAVMVGTHAPSFLNVEFEEAELIAVLRDPSRKTITTSLTNDVIGALDQLAEQLGISRTDVLLLTRAFLIVEGETDRRVIQHFYGSELDRERITIIPIHGTRRAKALPEATLLHRLQRPTMLLFDNTEAASSDERRAMEDIIAYWPPGSAPPQRIMFGAPDILRALPDRLFERALASLGASWPGWTDIESGFGSQDKIISFKRYMLNRIGLETREIQLVDRLLANADQLPSALVNSDLHQAMQTVLAYARPMVATP